MNHNIKIHNRGQLVWENADTDIAYLASSASIKLLGMDATYIQVYIDDVYFNLPSNDISIIRAAMETRMYHNGKPVDFGIDELFEV